MSGNKTKVKLNKDRRETIKQNIAQMKSLRTEILSNSGDLITKIDKIQYLTYSLGEFAKNYGTKDMNGQCSNVNKTLVLYYNSLNNVYEKLETLGEKYKGVDELFEKYNKFCEK
jgi:hypothetical protein